MDLKTFVKSIDNDNITIVKLIETKTVFKDRHYDIYDNSYTIEIKQGDFITELQIGFSKQKALNVYNVLNDSDIDLYLDKITSVKDNICGNCDTENVILITFDNDMKLCENCAAQYGLE